MNKKLLKSFAAAAMSVLAIACAKEQVGPVDGEICEATFDVAVPGGISTKTIADGTTAKELWYQVFDKDGNVIAGLGKTKHESLLSDRQTSVSMQLVKDQTYNIVFWAQSEGQTCYKFDDLSQITVDYAAAKANEESRDAFLAVKNITVNGPINETVEMKRPFAQLNIGTADAAIAAKAGVVIKTSKVEMKGLPNVLNTINGTTDGAVDVTFADNAVPSTEVLSVNGKEYTYLAMNYILAPAEGKEISDVKATFTAEGKDPVSLSAFSVPFQRNYRTNIIGNILTNSADFNVIVVPDFEDGDKVYDLDNINSAGALAALFANGGSGTLTGDIEMGRFIVPEGKNVVLNLNGKTVTLKGNSTGHGAKISGNVTIKGDGYFGDPTGESVGYMFDLYDSAVLNVEGNATYQCGLSCVQMSANSTVNISGGKWIGGSYSGKYWTINKMDSDKATTSVNITGGEFYKFNPAESYTENPVENWVAGGYKSTLVGDYYVVTKEDVTPVADQEGMNTAISGEGTSIDKPITVELPSNTTFTLDNGIANEGDKSRNITFVGDGTQTFDVITKAISAEGGMLNYQRGSSFTFKNMSIKAGEGNFDGVVCDELVFENCTITGKLTLFGKATFVNCVFENTMANQYSIWTWGGTDVKFDKCTFNTNGKAILLYGQATEANPTNLIVTNCTLNDRKNGAAGKAAIEIGNDYNATYNLTISGCVINGFAEGMNTGSKTWANKNSMDAAHLSVTIDDATIQ
ncbi:MAG: hypothetical protein MR575_06320 [Bacteroides sp.]|nr:hypothetical protein [Bacteroides sp.]